ncbi:restriction endonuclease subunit S [Marinobacter sp. ELB17]|uniref:restriction endonuclease subunit S n=1 Tax=Marinobacter sp. ELB17 TaxID=270374 RepID=UPI0000F3A4A2|nr:restriction endonuclease subunit S [Marinobacter sp. ELB17]EAZ99664.1 type I restriction-modification system, S subunit [Marinobacter sp. ELB17]
MNLLEAVPSHWIKASVGNYCDVQLGKMLQSDPASQNDESKRYLRAINITKHGLDLSHDFSMWIKPQEMEKFRLQRGDILVSEGGDAGRTAVFDCDEEFYFQNAINRIRPAGNSTILPEFIYYWFTFLKVAGYVEMVCNVATIAHFTAEKVKAAPLALPPLKTQHSIAQFLDEKTARIDGLIEKKCALLDRLAEKRQALITRAITKGLDPNAIMKPSGTEWLGHIPANWEVKKLRRVRRYMTSGSRDWAAYYADEGDRFLRMTNVTGEGIELDLSETRYVNLDGATEGTRTSVREGDILITITAELGAVAVIRKEIEGAYINQHLALFRPSPELCESGFLVNFLSTDMARAQFMLSGQGGTKQGLGFEQVNNVIIGFPPLREQELIGNFCSEIRRQSESVEQPLKLSIDKLIEYRSAVITAAVTGQLEIA